MSIEEIIELLENLKFGDEDAANDTDFSKTARKRHRKSAEMLQKAIALLKTHPDAKPNEPLTLEEMREMDGKPVFTSGIFDYDCGWRVIKQVIKDSYVEFTDGWHFDLDGYGENWIAYRRPPKED